MWLTCLYVLMMPYLNLMMARRAKARAKYSYILHMHGNHPRWYWASSPWLFQPVLVTYIAWCMDSCLIFLIVLLLFRRNHPKDLTFSLVVYIWMDYRYDLTFSSDRSWSSTSFTATASIQQVIKRTCRLNLQYKWVKEAVARVALVYCRWFKELADWNLQYKE